MTSTVILDGISIGLGLSATFYITVKLNKKNEPIVPFIAALFGASAKLTLIGLFHASKYILNDPVTFVTLAICVLVSVL